MSRRQKYASTSADYVDLTEDEPAMAPKASDKKAGACQCPEVQRLRARLQHVEAEKDRLALELAETKVQLKDTQAFLGQTVMAARMKEPSATTSTSSRSVAPAEPVNALRKRSRSPSITPIDNVPPPSSKKAKREALPNEPEQSTSTKAKSPAQPIAPVMTRKPQVERVTSRLPSGHVEDAIVGPKAKEPLPQLPSFKEGPRAKSISAKLDSSSSKGKRPALSSKSAPLRKLDKHELELPAKFDINPVPSTLEISRAFLRIQYGGSDMQMVQLVRADKRNSKSPIIRRLIFGQPEQNPKMPNRPGVGGFLYASRKDVQGKEPFGVFYKTNLSPRLWTYMGEYMNVVEGKMSGDFFASQLHKFKTGWAEYILGKKKRVYAKIRARVALRKAGRLSASDESDGSTDEDEDDSEENGTKAAASNKKMRKKSAERSPRQAMVDNEVFSICHGRGLPVTIQDMINAFSRGDEGLKIVRMTCVGYDHDFANDIESGFQNFSKVGRVGGKATELPKEDAEGKAPEAAVKRTSNGVVEGSSTGNTSAEPRRSTRNRRPPRSMDSLYKGSSDSVQSDSDLS